VNSTSKGQKIDGATPDGYNPLHLVMNAGSATTFIELGADPNAFGSSIVGAGRGPPVFIAAVNGDASVLKAMLAGGGFLAGQYCWWATQQGKVSTVKAMHEHGHFDLGYVREQDLSQSSSMKGRHAYYPYDIKKTTIAQAANCTANGNMLYRKNCSEIIKMLEEAGAPDEVPEAPGAIYGKAYTR